MPASFDDFVTERLPAALRFTGVLTGDRHLAEDVVQEVLIKTHKQWAVIGAKDRPEAYVRRMIVNEYVSWLRKWARIIPTGKLHTLDNQHSAPDHAGQVTDRADLAQRLAKLAPRPRAVIVLRYYEGLSDPEIAEVLGCRAATVRGYASRALATLRLDIDMDVGAGADHAELSQLAVATGKDLQ